MKSFKKLFASCLPQTRNTRRPSLSQNLKDIRNLMECNVCLCVPKSVPIYQCERGHILCSECRPKLTKCPSCRITLGDTRCLIAEKALEELPSPCSFEGTFIIQ